MGHFGQAPGPCGKCSPARPAWLRERPASGFFRDLGECGASGWWSAGGEAGTFPLGAGGCGPRAGPARQCGARSSAHTAGVAGALLTRAPGRRPRDRDPRSAPAVPRRQSHRLARELYLAGQPWPGTRRERVGDPLSEGGEDAGPQSGVSGLCVHCCWASALCLQEQRKGAEWVLAKRECALQNSKFTIGLLENPRAKSFEIYSKSTYCVA